MRKVELLPTRDCEASYGPVNEDVDAIKERKACDRWHPTCYIVYKFIEIKIYIRIKK